MTGFDSIKVRFKNTENQPSPFANTREVPFVDSYLTVLKSIIDDVKTEYFWFFASFMNLKTIDLDYRLKIFILSWIKEVQKAIGYLLQK